MTAKRSPSDAKQRLLEAAGDYMLDHGLQGLTLRTVADAIGTSHRMLLYYFGTREEFVHAVLRHVSRRKRARMPLLANESLNIVEVLTKSWQQLLDDKDMRTAKLFFESYSAAIRDPEGYAGFLNTLVEEWVRPIELWLHYLLPQHAGQARQIARMLIALNRGLLLDQIATGDSAATTEVMKTFGLLLDGKSATGAIEPPEGANRSLAQLMQEIVPQLRAAAPDLAARLPDAKVSVFSFPLDNQNPYNGFTVGIACRIADRCADRPSRVALRVSANDLTGESRIMAEVRWDEPSGAVEASLAAGAAHPQDWPPATEAWMAEVAEQVPELVEALAAAAERGSPPTS